jgi:HK97 gp10 family phage protein
MVTVAVNISGDKALLRRLKSLVPRARKQALTRSARVAMKPLLANAKSQAPSKSGVLRKAIKLRAMKRNRRGIVGIFVDMSEKRFQGDTYYGAFQEFGWHAGKRDKSLRVRGKWSGVGSAADKRKAIAGKHFMEQAFDTGRSGAEQVFKRQLWVEMDRIIRGG